MNRFMISTDLVESLPAEAGVIRLPKFGEALRDRFVIIWQAPSGIVFGTDYQRLDEEELIVWGEGGWYGLGEVDDPDPSNPGDYKIIAVFWADK